MMHAAFPVGARSSIFGLLGSSPIWFKVLSQCLVTTLITWLLPTPPPPVEVKEFLFQIEIMYRYQVYNIP